MLSSQRVNGDIGKSFYTKNNKTNRADTEVVYICHVWVFEQLLLNGMLSKAVRNSWLRGYNSNVITKNKNKVKCTRLVLPSRMHVGCQQPQRYHSEIILCFFFFLSSLDILNRRYAHLNMHIMKQRHSQRQILKRAVDEMLRRIKML